PRARRRRHDVGGLGVPGRPGRARATAPRRAHPQWRLAGRPLRAVRSLMPAYPVINRRNISPLVRKTLLVSDEALERINEIGEAMHVTQGSLVDTALRHLSALSP